ncbi:hypothetical protein DMENIID0001_059130 [Sergentomyia squamirostris]
MDSLEEVVRTNCKTTDAIAKRLDGYMVINNANGRVIKTTFTDTMSQRKVVHLFEFMKLSRSCVRDLNPPDDLATVRLSTTSHEIMIIYAEEFTLIGKQALK